MGTPDFDAIIIGGGPGGSTAASYLAKAGRRVLVLEKEIFPRFHIGESLLPYNRRIFNELGLFPLLEAAEFPKKFGAQFHLGNGSKQLKFVFRNGIFTRETSAIQVERAQFDHILLQHSRRLGADVREGWTVLRFESNPDSIGIEAQDRAGSRSSFTASFLVDASGRGNLTGNQEQIRVTHPRLKKVALFGHFRGVRLDPGEKGGDTIIVRLENKWFWLIPISREKTSIGCVMDQAELKASAQSPADLFFAICQSSSVMRDRVQNASLVGSIQTTSDFSYRNKRFAGHRLVRVGDAAGFMDPIFSAGVYLAMSSGKQAAQAVAAAVRARTDGHSLFTAYERRFYGAMKTYWQMVENFYTTEFMEVFMEPREKYEMASAVNAILAGELEGGWRLWWRMRLFFLVVKAQRRLGFLPRITFAERTGAPPS